MATKSIPLDSPTLDKLAHFGASVQHWTEKHTEASIRAAEALQTVVNVRQARRQMLIELVKDSGVDVRLIREINVSGESIDVVLADEAPTPSEPPPSEPPVDPAG